MDLRDGQRLATVVFDRLLPKFEWRRRGWRRRPSHHGSRMHRGGWLSKNDWGRAEHRLFRGHHSGGQGTYWRAGYGALIDFYQVSLHRLRGRKCLRARRRYRTGNGAIDIRDIHGLLVDDDRVVNVIDHGRVHRGVRDIDVAHVT